MKLKSKQLIHLFMMSMLSLGAVAQEHAADSSPAHPERVSLKTTATKAPLPQRRFVLDTINSAVALEESDPQDRLRVLAAASELAASVNPKLARQLGEEGIDIELRLLTSGIAPSVSIMATGKVDCASAASFVNSLSPSAAGLAEQSLVGAVSKCSKQTLERTRMLLDGALEQGVVVPRALLATINATGAKSEWAQQRFEKAFGGLPQNSQDSKSQAPLFAQLYSSMAPNVEKQAAARSGIKLLDWLAALEESGSRNVAVSMTTSSMQKVLGPKDYAQAIRSDITALSITQLAGQHAQVELPAEEGASVMQAMKRQGIDRTDVLRNMPPSKRAREAAADGFASGKAGDRDQSNRYFEVAFGAINEAWPSRGSENIAALIEEVSEAAAQVDSISALQRAQKLDEPAAQAIGMLAVARVVAGGQHP